ncbi:MAG: hypothetical protein HY308_17315 [Gammaproteobacteria bacterium]|nr:hypothetical protein [Gammaproteobacteria bacterium]
MSLVLSEPGFERLQRGVQRPVYAVGYVANAEQTPTALLGIRWLMDPLPAVLLLLAVPLLLTYPLGRREHERLCQQLGRR